MTFEKVTIIGFGLIGSSISHALRKHKAAKWIVCADTSQNVCDRVLDLKLADEVTTDIAASVASADIVFICVPVGAMEAVTKIIAPNLKEGAIVTDVGSVKGLIADIFKKNLPKNVHGIPGHPIAGTEHSGPEAGFAELFVDRWYLITPIAGTDRNAVEKLSTLWKTFGSNIEEMDPEHHDKTLAITSHLPHLIAYTIVGTATDLEGDLKSEVIKFSASGFRDFTRIAASDPIMWRDVFLNNKEAVLEILGRFNEDLSAMQRAIRKSDGEMLEDVFTRTRAIRRAIIEAKQDTPEDRKVRS